jgi:hypothetical protein
MLSLNTRFSIWSLLIVMKLLTPLIKFLISNRFSCQGWDWQSNLVEVTPSRRKKSRLSIHFITIPLTTSTTRPAFKGFKKFSMINNGGKNYPTRAKILIIVLFNTIKFISKIITFWYHAKTIKASREQLNPPGVSADPVRLFQFDYTKST